MDTKHESIEYLGAVIDIGASE